MVGNVLKVEYFSFFKQNDPILKKRISRHVRIAFKTSTIKEYQNQTNFNIKIILTMYLMLIGTL